MTQLVLLQFEIAFGKPAENYQKVAELFAEAALKPGDLVILPELWNTGYDLTRLETIADLEGKQTQVFLQELAEKYQVLICGGSIARKTEEGFFNTSYLVTPEKITAAYDKVHLFRLMKEEQFLTAGNQNQTVELGNLRVTPLICYDLRFPEWFRKFGADTDLFVIAAQWPKARIEQWRKLLIARGIENQCFVVGVNRVGSDPENLFGGHSLVVNPVGEIILELGEKEAIGKIELDLKEIKEVRNTLSVFYDRRPELY